MSDLQMRTHTPQKPKLVGKSMSSFMGIFRMRDTLSWRRIGSTDPRRCFAGTKARTIHWQASRNDHEDMNRSDFSQDGTSVIKHNSLLMLKVCSELARLRFPRMESGWINYWRRAFVSVRSTREQILEAYYWSWRCSVTHLKNLNYDVLNKI